jgi:hypothetical protein
VQFTDGMHLLGEFRLTPDAGSRRVTATCCNTPVFLEFKGGHWLSIYGLLWSAGDRPPAAMRTMTRDLPDRSVLPNDIPNLKTQSPGFFATLFFAWFAMGFRAPQIPVKETVDA